MKHYKQIFVACVLTLALSVTALAGDMQAPGIALPRSESSAAGDMQAPGATAPAGDVMTVLMLAIVQNLLSRV